MRCFLCHSSLLSLFAISWDDIGLSRLPSFCQDSITWPPTLSFASWTESWGCLDPHRLFRPVNLMFFCVQDDHMTTDGTHVRHVPRKRMTFNVSKLYYNFAWLIIIGLVMMKPNHRLLVDLYTNYSYYYNNTFNTRPSSFWSGDIILIVGQTQVFVGTKAKVSHCYFKRRKNLEEFFRTDCTRKLWFVFFPHVIYGWGSCMEAWWNLCLEDPWINYPPHPSVTIGALKQLFKGDCWRVDSLCTQALKGAAKSPSLLLGVNNIVSKIWFNVQ